MTPFIFIIMALATWRITHLIVEDSFPPIARPRNWASMKWPNSSFVYLWNCTYCSSVWVGAGVTWAADWRFSVPAPVLVIFALSCVAAFGETVVDWLDRYGIPS